MGLFPAEFALLEAVAGFIGRVLEIEDLKQSLNRLEDALAITKALMEDNSTLDPETDLPTRRPSSRPRSPPRWATALAAHHPAGPQGQDPVPEELKDARAARLIGC